MKKTYVLIAIGILALVILIVNYVVMQPISQQQYRDFEQMLPTYGLTGSLSYYGSIDKAMEEGGLMFNYEWYNLYEAYIVTQNEILIVSAVCVSVAIICFSIAVYYMQKSYKKSRIESYVKEKGKT